MSSSRLAGVASLPDLLGHRQQLLSPLLQIACSTSLTADDEPAAAAPDAGPGGSGTAAAVMRQAWERMSDWQRDDHCATLVWCSRLMAQILRGQQLSSSAAARRSRRRGSRRGEDDGGGGGDSSSAPELLCSMVLFRKVANEKAQTRPALRSLESLRLGSAGLLASAPRATAPSASASLRHRAQPPHPQAKAAAAAAPACRQHAGGAGAGKAAPAPLRLLGFAEWAQVPGALPAPLATNAVSRLLGCLWRHLRCEQFKLVFSRSLPDSTVFLAPCARGERRARLARAQNALAHAAGPASGPAGPEPAGAARRLRRVGRGRAPGARGAPLQGLAREQHAPRVLPITGATQRWQRGRRWLRLAPHFLFPVQVLLISCAAALNGAAWLAGLASDPSAPVAPSTPAGGAAAAAAAGGDVRAAGSSSAATTAATTAQRLRLWQQALLALHHLLQVRRRSPFARTVAIHWPTHSPGRP